MVHNSGTHFKTDKSDEKFKITWKVNYANTFLLNDQLLSLGLVKDNGKIIFISSHRGCLGLIEKNKPEVF